MNLDLMEFILEIIYLKIKDRAYVINPDKYSDIRTRWIALHALKNVNYFDSFEVEHIPKEILKIIGNKNIQANIFKIQA